MGDDTTLGPPCPDCFAFSVISTHSSVDLLHEPLSPLLVSPVFKPMNKNEHTHTHRHVSARLLPSDDAPTSVTGLPSFE